MAPGEPPPVDPYLVGEAVVGAVLRDGGRAAVERLLSDPPAYPEALLRLADESADVEPERR